MIEQAYGENKKKMPRNALPECQLNIAYKACEGEEGAGELNKGCECGALSL